MTKKEKREEVIFIFVMLVFAAVYSMKEYEHIFSGYNTTLFAFSYQYGFISRGLLGTIWQGLDALLPWNLMSYKAIYLFSGLMNIIYIFLLITVCVLCIRKADVKQKRTMYYMSFFLGIVCFPVYWTDENYGRLDVYLMILTLLSMILIIKEKWEWMVIPFCIIATMLHQGFVFTSVNIILVLFWYKAFMRPEQRKKYIMLFTLTFLSVSVLFVYFEFLSHVGGQEVANDIMEKAKAISIDGQSYNTSLINHEILGKGVFMDEWWFHKYNYEATIFFIIFFIPFILMGVRFLKGLVKDAKNKWPYLLIALGASTLVPQIVLKVDYGRYSYYAFFYYIMAVMACLAMKDEHVVFELANTKERLRRHMISPELLLLYIMLFMPFLDVLYSDVIDKVKVVFFP